MEKDAEELTFTNTRKTGDLSLTKTVVSDASADHSKKFTFTITLGDTTISKKYGDIEFKNGVATVYLADGKTAKATELPTDLTYTITEATAEGFKVTGKTKDSGKIETAISEAAFTNTREVGDLEVTKTVVSNVAGDDKAEFEFTVTLSDTTISKTYGDMTFVDGVATFKLKAGETAKAEGLPTEVTFTVTETANNDFTTEMSGDTGAIATTASAAEFTNTRITTSATVKKVWDDSDNKNNKRPSSVKVSLVANGKTIQTVTLDEKNKWTATVSDLPATEGGKKITYTWTEETVTNYTLSSTKTNGTETTITNKVNDTPPGTPGVPFIPDEDLGMGMLINVGDCLE